MEANVPFDKRLKRITRRHDKMANGYVKTINPDGLIVVRPRAFRARFPLKSLLIVLALGFLFKGFILFYLGDDAYSARVDALKAGTTMEKVGAWVMQSDPATRAIAGSFEGFFGQ